MCSEPGTNTRTLEGTLRETIGRLSECKQTPAVLRIIAEAKRYLVILRTWESSPPTTAVQHEVIDEVMGLLKESLTIPLEMPDRQRAPTSEDSPEISVRPSEPPPPDSETRAQRKIGRVRVQRHSLAQSESNGSPAAATFAAGPGVTVLRPYELRWREVPARLDVLAKRLHDDPERGPCRTMVRLGRGAELPSHRHGVAEDLVVLSGSLRIGDVEVHAGDIVHSEPGATSGIIRSVGECTFLLVGSDRSELR